MPNLFTVRTSDLPTEGFPIMLSELHLKDVGPAPALDVEFAERLNKFVAYCTNYTC